jgi:hypothetical protein
MLQAILTPMTGWEKAMRILSTAGIIAGLMMNALAVWGAHPRCGNFRWMFAGCYLMYAANISRTRTAAHSVSILLFPKK